MEPVEFQVGDATYRTGRLTAKQQFHVTRRLGKVLSAFVDAFKGQLAGEKIDPAQFIEPITTALGDLSDADCDYVIDTCLAVCHRQDGNAWARVKAGDRLMYDDIDMVVMLRIVAKVLEVNLAGFFSDVAGALRALPATGAT